MEVKSDVTVECIGGQGAIHRLALRRAVVKTTIHVKTLICKFKNMFLTFIKNIKMHKNIKLRYPFKKEVPSIRIK